jgi:hypothetical protein
MPPTRVACATLLLVIAACGGDTTGPGTPPPPPPPPPPANLITIDGNNVGASDGLVFISQNGQLISDGSVTVTANGVPATPINSGYFYDFGTPLSAGATLTVQATRLGKTAAIAGTVPATPILSAPAVNGAVIPGTPVTVTWASATNPSYFIVRLGYRVGTTGTSIRDSVGGAVRTVNLATTAIPVGATALSVDVRAIGPETLSGDVAPTSRLSLSATTENRDLTLSAGP